MEYSNQQTEQILYDSANNLLCKRGKEKSHQVYIGKKYFLLRDR